MSDYSNIEGIDRLETVWEHATRLRTVMDAKVHWYTPKRGLNESDNFTLISLQNIGDYLDKQYPPAVFLMMIFVPQKGKWRNFIVLSFPERLGS
ncbi:hypothetical protein CEP48_00305 [Mergibacter septicus]|uniref:Uncharacterized protein n=1 Tax=Mergibacter septicus TaxID=221402 RepID=A0A8E3MEK8_9PAST|nr:hypothetical protein [Mergibacter septicus]AWX14724.1 hypothetical protein CEP47_00305 [Mergibacter septicus]QDJ13975.1 hypothetical protein CEP48_00305 [Mergibacter septicus]UTU48576.1 hypothetical protein HLL31_07325 [Mergibacter septicus]WMR95794.1 hypothetical protein RDJ12_07675 [Mergibacter septicus]